MLHADFMKCSDDRPLEERERAFDRVRVDIAKTQQTSGGVTVSNFRLATPAV